MLDDEIVVVTGALDADCTKTRHVHLHHGQALESETLAVWVASVDEEVLDAPGESLIYAT